MLRTRFDRFKIKARMEKAGIEKFEELAKAAGISPTTLYNTMDNYNWRGATIDHVANALDCSPLELLTVDDVSQTA
jgi:lambda repressor-like predicted transcriptional regulator